MLASLLMLSDYLTRDDPYAYWVFMNIVNMIINNIVPSTETQVQYTTVHMKRLQSSTPIQSTWLSPPAQPAPSFEYLLHMGPWWTASE